MAFTDDVWVFDNVVTFNVDWSSGARELHYSFVQFIHTDNITAAGSVQGDATLLAGGGVHIVTTVASGTGVILTPNANVSGLVMEVYNLGANNLNVYPAVGHNIIDIGGTDLGANTPYVLSVGKIVEFRSRDANTWFVWNVRG